MRNKIAIVIPARDERHSLPKVLEDINALSLEGFIVKVFVVDDGSEDDIFRIAHGNGVEVIRHPVSLGVGGALKTGYLIAKEWSADIIIQLDAARFLDLILNENADMIIGSRFSNGSPPLSLTRKIGIRFFTWLVNKLSGYKLTDITSGYRVFRAEVLDNVIFPSEKHWAIEMTLLAGKHKLKVKETSIKPLIRKSGKSQFHELMTFILYPIRAIKQIIDIYL